MNASQWVFIEPNDVLMFRDAKPFTAQQSFAARSMFPPTPQTLQGAIRTAALEAAGVDITQYAGGKIEATIATRFGRPPSREHGGSIATLGTFQMRGPFVARRTNTGIERLFRMPLDILQNKTSKSLTVLKPQFQEGFKCDPPFTNWQPLVASSMTGLEEAEGWLTEAEFVNRYLKGQVSTEVVESDAIFVREERVGLGLDTKRRANAQSQFYHAQFVRLCPDVGLLVEVSAETFPQNGTTGIMKLGGEGRSAHYETVEFNSTFPTNVSGNLKLVLLTPAYFDDGWQPKNMDWSRWVGNGKLLSLALGKPQYISGWDVANNRPKPLRHYVPAGSVYFFEGATVSGAPFTQSPDGDLDHGALGFGVFAAGTW